MSVRIFSLAIMSTAHWRGKGQGARGKQAWRLSREQRDGAYRLVTISLISDNSSLCEIHLCDTPRHGLVTDGHILSLGSCPSSNECCIAKTINFNDVIDEFASAKGKEVTL